MLSNLKIFNLLDAEFLMHPVIILFFLFELNKQSKKIYIPSTKQALSKCKHGVICR